MAHGATEVENILQYILSFSVYEKCTLVKSIAAKCNKKTPLELVVMAVTQLPFLVPCLRCHFVSSDTKNL